LKNPQCLGFSRPPRGVYRHGESGMDHTPSQCFRGQKRSCVTGNCEDFIRYPPGKSHKDVIPWSRLKAGETTRWSNRLNGTWCRHSEAPE